MNRLQYEKSPYLQQHKNNPVDWYPWGKEAFEKAEAENKPLMVSIGYSTCHWCHVMEQESFENAEVAAILNEKFIPVKVDREERPDVDAIYMSACQAMNGHGGWPLNVFITPDQKPFYAATYIPRNQMGSMPGIMDVLSQLSDIYRDDPERVAQVGNDISKALEPRAVETRQLNINNVHTAFRAFTQQFDSSYGGFGSAPKFPSPHIVMYLLHYYHQFESEGALYMATSTLDAMASGGIRDHIGGGFSRYATDQAWLVPHFEKMLYDNALLLMAYTEAYQLTGETRYKEVVEEIIEYVHRDLTHEEGAFFCGEDADSEGEEGKFYVWTPEEIEDVLGEERGEQFAIEYGIDPAGNFEGKSIPNRINRPTAGWSDAERRKALRALYEHREKRVRPFRDEKILTSWNGWMIASMAKAGRVFQEEKWTKLAEEAYRFIETRLQDQNGRFKARWKDGDVQYDAYVDDYANMIWASTELYASTWKPEYIENASAWAETMISYYYDQENGGFFLTASDGEPLLFRPKEAFDGAAPSGNSVAAVQLMRLARLAGNMEFERTAEKTWEAFSASIEQAPTAFGHLMQGLVLFHRDRKEVVIRPAQDDEAFRVKTYIQRAFHPEVTSLVAEENTDLSRAAPFAEDYPVQNGKTTIYVCRDFSCHAPVHSTESMKYLFGAGQDNQ
ncbi:thioredoxin domain-containing protein [Marinococcus halotolerans]|uniref:thioredoxin domain-containing protein n=1 Tax=Marinococcus halotolerans TaxID=301092 RepID=UPI000425898C|nr:thioredoxin domain-containing protein [Marinococcus halotolerans]